MIQWSEISLNISDDLKKQANKQTKTFLFCNLSSVLLEKFITTLNILFAREMNVSDERRQEDH